jgi:integrase
LTTGKYLGFRKLPGAGTPGTWLARHWDDATKKNEYKPLGDFAGLPEKKRFDAAKTEAEKWFLHLEKGGVVDVPTIAGACRRYVERVLAGLDGKSRRDAAAAADDMERRFLRLIYANPLGALDLAKAKERDFEKWKQGVMEAARAHASSKTRDSEEVERLARASFNRNAVALRAALNDAYRKNEVTSTRAWKEILRAYRGAEGKRNLYLTRDERQALLRHATPEAQRYLKTLMLIPLRPGDVARLKARDFDPRQRVLHVPQGKTPARDVPLSSAGMAHFQECTRGKLPDAPLIARDDGSPYTREMWRHAFASAAAAAGLPRAACAYTLRHCAITDLIVGGLDVLSVARLAGTSIAQIQSTYGHLLSDRARDALEKLSVA